MAAFGSRCYTTATRATSVVRRHFTVALISPGAAYGQPLRDRVYPLPRAEVPDCGGRRQHVVRVIRYRMFRSSDAFWFMPGPEFRAEFVSGIRAKGYHAYY